MKPCDLARPAMSWLAAAAAMALWASPSLADPLLDETVGFAGQVFYIDAGVPGVVVAAVRHGDTTIAGFGETRRGNGTVPGGDTVLRIGSITKVFAGAMLAEAVSRHEVAFADPVAPLLTGRLGDAAARQPAIRLIDLVTHSAGLPREVPHEPGPDAEPFATITDDAFASYLETEPLLFPPGSAISYSNFGFDVLSAALQDAGGAPYAELLADRITGPLGMPDTGFSVTDAMSGRLMSGHGFDGQPLPEVPSGDVITGSGGLRTTAADMVRWLRWHLTAPADGDGDGVEAEAWLLDHALYRQRGAFDLVSSMDESGHMDAMGLGWVAMNRTADRPFVLQKAGALQGQMSYVAFAPSEGVGVFVLINQFDFAAAYAMADFANQLVVELSGG